MDIEKAYDDFLYDCHVANRRLTDEDWQWYGREEHHVEVPNRDDGLLTPTNSQFLTTYQHWVAGVLQSEVLQKGCFAMIPAGVLPLRLDLLRDKWVKELGREGATKYKETTTPEERSKRAVGDSTPEERSRRTKEGWAKLTPEQRRERAIKSNCSRSEESIKEASRKRLEKWTPEKRAQAHEKRMLSTTPEQRSEAARRRWAKLTPDERREMTKNATEAAAKKARQKKATETDNNQ